MGRYGANLDALTALLELTEAEADHLAEGYSERTLSGPTIFVTDFLQQAHDPNFELRFGSKKAQRLKREAKALLREVKAVLLGGGPDALLRYLDAHPLQRYLKR